MKTFALATLTVVVLSSPCLPEEVRPAQVRDAAANNGVTRMARAAVAIGRDGQNASHRCSTENPNIEYRDCVNASTRDPNAKVRMG